MGKPAITPNDVNRSYTDDIRYLYAAHPLIALCLGELKTALLALITSISRKPGSCSLTHRQLRNRVNALLNREVTVKTVKRAARDLVEAKLLTLEWKDHGPVYSPAELPPVFGYQGFGITIAATTHPDLSWGAKLLIGYCHTLLQKDRVYLYSQKIDKTGEGGWTNKRLAEKLHISTRSIKRGLAELVKAEFLCINGKLWERRISINPDWEERYAPVFEKFQQERVREMLAERQATKHIKRLKKKLEDTNRGSGFGPIMEARGSGFGLISPEGGAGLGPILSQRSLTGVVQPGAKKLLTNKAIKAKKNTLKSISRFARCARFNADKTSNTNLQATNLTPLANNGPGRCRLKKTVRSPGCAARAPRLCPTPR
jgi:hypothetical protein